MYKLIQRKKKLLLAVFGVMLMIVFIIPSTFKNDGTSRADIPIGTINGKKLTGQDEATAKDDLRLLRNAGYFPLTMIGGTDPQQRMAMVSPLFAELESHPLTYALLVREAKDAGIQVSASQVETSLREGLGFRRIEDIPPTEQDQLREAVKRFLLVQTNLDRAASGLKVTEPYFKQRVSSRLQQVKFDVVDLDAEKLLEKVPAPTPDQIQAHYDKYAKSAPKSGGFAATQPATPGYLVPDRFKIQYLELPADRLAEAFLKAESNLWEFDMAGLRYYKANLDEFQTKPEPPTTAPSTLPTTSPTTSPATAPATMPTTVAAAPMPTTRPFKEVTAEIRRKLLTGSAMSEDKAVTDLKGKYAAFTGKLSDQLRSRLDAAYQAYMSGSAAPTTAPTTGPSAQPFTIDASFGTYEYLEKFADAFEKETGVRPMPHQVANEWKTERELGNLPGIGFASATGTSFQNQVEKLAGRERIKPTTGPATAPSTQPTLATADLFKPSVVLSNGSGNSYVFRLAAFDPAHPPALAEVQDQIAKDLKLAAAYELAKTEGKRLMDAAKSSPVASGSLSAAAKASGYLVINTDLRNMGQQMQMRGPTEVTMAEYEMIAKQTDQALKDPERGPMSLMFLGRGGLQFSALQIPDPMSNGKLIAAIAPLPAQASTANPHPATMVDLPAARKVILVEISDFVLPWPQETESIQRLNIYQGLSEGIYNEFAREWFNADETAKRTGYEPIEGKKR